MRSHPQQTGYSKSVEWAEIKIKIKIIKIKIKIKAEHPSSETINSK